MQLPHQQCNTDNVNGGEKIDLDLNLLTSWSVHAEVLPWVTDLPSLVSIAPAIFL